MIFGDNNQRFGDDFFESTRMSFGDHIEDLRRHLIRAIAGFVVAVIIAFPLALFFVVDWIKYPVQQRLNVYSAQLTAKKMEELKKDPEIQKLMKERTEKLTIDVAPIIAKIPGIKAPKGPLFVEITRKKKLNLMDLKVVQKIISDSGARIVTLSVQEGFMVFLQVSIVTGLIIGSPWIFVQIWAFISAGLYPHEKKIINRYLPFAILLFLTGIFFCYFVVLPKAIDALLYFNYWFDLSPQIRLSEWLGFAIWVPVIFGISFQTPLVMMAIERVGLVTVDMFRQWRKFAWLGMFIAAAVFTPTGDPITFLYLAIPMCLFYELGIVLCRYNKRKSGFDLDVPDDEEMVEV